MDQKSGMKFSWLMKMAWRDSKASYKKLSLFMASIVLGIAAVVSVESFSDNLQFMDRNDIRKLCEFQLKHRGAFMSVFNGFPRTDDGARVAYLNDLDLNKTMATLDEYKEQIEDGLYLDISTILHRRFKDDARWEKIVRYITATNNK